MPPKEPMRTSLVLALAACTAATSLATAAPKRAQTQNLAPRLPGGRVSVLPVLFVPRNAQATDAIDAAVAEQLQIARAHYQDLLGTTFAVASGPVAVLHGEYTDDYYQTDARAERVMRELLAWRHTDRYTADVVFLVLYASSGTPIGGGGIPFNGAPGTGGGYIEMDLTSLTTDKPYPFQSTLVHELGHAFGLPHAECYGYDQMTSSSIMSYDPQHWSSGTTQSATRGDFSPEDRAALALNQRVFPGLRYDHARDGAIADLALFQSCFLPPVSTDVSPLVDLIGTGFELFYDGARVNGPDAALYSRRQASESCRTSREWYPNVRVECRYNGAMMRDSPGQSGRTD
jgi:hypothetical protein